MAVKKMTSEVYNIDCMEYMKTLPDKAFDLAVVDPPYFSGPEKRGYYGQKVSKVGVRRDYPISPTWNIPSSEYFSELERVSKHYIVWGCNYYNFIFPPVAFQIVKLLQPIFIIASEFSDLCGTECYRVKVLQKAK